VKIGVMKWQEKHENRSDEVARKTVTWRFGPECFHRRYFPLAMIQQQKRSIGTRVPITVFDRAISLEVVCLLFDA